MNSNAILVAEGISKTFRKKGGPPVEVLHNTNLEILPGSSIAIVGKSGSGKSTFLHILGALERPTQGAVYFLGQDLGYFSEKRISEYRNRELGFVFQFHYLMVEFSALENVMMPALIRGISKKEAEREAEGLLERVGLSQRISHKPSELSGGEQQRVAIARALILKPKILLTDEMTGNLDPATGHNVFEMIQAMRQDMGTAIVSVTHDEVLAKSYEKIYRLQNGRLVRYTSE